MLPRLLTVLGAVLALAAGLPGASASEARSAPPRPAGADAGSPEAASYGQTPAELVPYRQAGQPYQRFFVEPPAFRGPGRDRPDPAVEAVPIGILLPHEGPDVALAEKLRNGIRMAIEEANAEGGYRPGVPFVGVERDENLAWGAAANAVVELATDPGVFGFVGALEDSASHVMTRVLLKVEVPMVNTAGPDPTLTEHMVPWIVRVRPDDRQASYRLAKRIFLEDGHRRVVVFRSNDRYGRVGTRELVDAAQRLRHPIALELRFEAHETSWDAALQRIREVRPDAIVLWGRAEPAGRALKALRQAGLDVPVYGPDRLVDPAFLQSAGAAAEGTVFTYPFDPRRSDPLWTGFRGRYRERYGEDPEAFAAYGFDGTRMLLEAIRRAGLNPVRIREALFARGDFPAVTGKVSFDVNRNNVDPVVLGRVVNGAFRFEP